MASSNEIPDPASDYQGFQASFFAALRRTVQAANALPADLEFHRLIDNSFAETVDHAGSQTLSLSNRLLERCADHAGFEFEHFKDVDDVKDHYTQAENVVDNLLERTDILLDEMSGRGRNNMADAMKQTSEVVQISTKTRHGLRNFTMMQGRNIPRPQVNFKDIDNSSTPFTPKIVTKPHAKVPLSAPQSLLHPYKYEIENIEYPDHMFEPKKPQLFRPFDPTLATWVDTEEGVEAMMEDLKDSTEIAVDLEHHSYRSYQGFTCLLQISSREKDFLVDTLGLRDELQVLNEYFADPNIVKIFHGAESDIQWLQRDLGLYVVNLFDTYWASKLLKFPQFSLAYLLQKYCSFKADKKYQLADWRQRPLPDEMRNYACADTHFLHYIYDELRSALLDQNLLQPVLKNSANVSLIKYVKEQYDFEEGSGSISWARYLTKKQITLNPVQLQVYKAIHKWRDDTAREEDESVDFVLPNDMLICLARSLPSEAANVIGCCNPCPPLVRMNAQNIARLVARAKLDALNRPETDEKPKTQPNTSAVTLNTASHQRPKVTRSRAAVKTDPSLFDLSKISKQRALDMQKYGKDRSTLFGSTLSIVAPETEAYKLVLSIRETIQMRPPTGVLKTSPTVTESTTKPAVEQVEEHVFVPGEERQTKKRKGDETLVLRKFEKAKKKAIKNKE